MGNCLMETSKPCYKKPIVWIITVAVVILIVIVAVVVGVSSSLSNDISGIPGEDETSSIPNLCGLSNGEPSHNCFGGWFYPGPESAEFNAEFAKQKNWNYVFFQQSISSNSVLNNIQEFTKRNISFHFLTLAEYYSIDHPSIATKAVADILDFVAENKIKIAGIHIDTEPHVHPDYDFSNWTACNLVFQRYVKMIEEVRKVMNRDPTLLFSAAVAWFYSSETVVGHLENGRGFDLVSDTRLHMLVPMIYPHAGNNVQTVVSLSSHYMKDQAPTVCGMGLREFATDELFRTAVDGVFASIAKDVNLQKYFYGVSVFDNRLYTDWPPRTS